MESIKLKITNWDKFNTKETLKTPYWFKVHVNIPASESLFGLSPATKWIWICLLSEAMRKKSSEFTLKLKWASQQWAIKISDILEAIDLLIKNGLLHCDSEPTRSELGVDSESTRHRVKERRVDKNSVFDFEKVFEKYPKRPNQNKKLALKKLQSDVIDSIKYQDLIRATDNYAQYISSRRVEERFIKQFSTFANNWEEWVKPIEPRKNNIPIATIHSGPDPREGPLKPEIRELLNRSLGRKSDDPGAA